MPTRLRSLDVFRGLTMAGMVIVNNPGDWGNVYWPLLHAEWHGWTPTDLIFPFFLFIVGVSITLSKRSLGWGRILWRGALIFALGLFLAGFPNFDLSRWRIPGVLQRIAVCYVVAAGLYSVGRNFNSATANRARLGLASSIGAIAAALTLLYWLILRFVPNPAGAAFDLSAEGNLGAYIDRALMSGHLWKPRWDPEGLLSTLPAIATTLFGIVAGLWLRSEESGERKAALLTAAGIVGIALGFAWHPFFPINKNLWTSSYVLFTAGAAALLLALCYWVIDVKGWQRGTTPFVILGANAITLYVASGLLVELLGHIRVPGAGEQSVALSRYIYQSWFVPLASPKNASLLYAIAHLAVLFALLAWMYRRRLFLRV